MQPYISEHPKPLLPLLTLLTLIALPSIILSIKPPIYIPGCGTYTGPKFLKTVVLSPEGMVVTCNTAERSYVKIPFPKDNVLGTIHFARYKCSWGTNTLVNFNLMNEALHCVMGCPYPAERASLNVFSEHGDCKTLNEAGGSEPWAYINCEIRCKDGHYSDSQGSNHVNSQIVYCVEQLGQAVWEIADGTTKDPFVRCSPGCFMYGSDREDAYGMISNFKSVGPIDGVRRYVSGDLYCDSYEGFFAVSKELKPNLLVTCVSGTHWEPVRPDFYCRKVGI